MIGLIVLSLFTFSHQSLACGKLSLSATNIVETWGRNAELSPQEFQVFRSDTSKPCNYFVTFTAGQSNSYNRRILRHASQKIDYQLYRAPFRDEGQVLKAYPGPVHSGNVVFGSFVAGQRNNQFKHTYFFARHTPANLMEIPPAGTYTDNFIISVHQGNGPAPNIPADASMTVYVREYVPGMIELSLVPTGSEFQLGDRVMSMDFGTLHTGDTKDMDLNVITNSGYKIYMSSSNGGVLKHESKSVKTTVPYIMVVNSGLKNLSHKQPVEVAHGPRRSNTQNARDNVRVTIGDVENKMAGRYQDVITVFATTSE